jgi:hypothetical protein
VTAANPRVPAWSAAIDWLADGDYTDGNDDVTADLRVNPGIVIQRGKDSARTRARPMVAAGGFDLDNQARVYSAENSASPVYQLVLPDRPARIQATIGTEVEYDAADVGYDDVDHYYDGQATLTLLTGLTDEPVQKPSRRDRSVQVSVLGSMAVLRGRTISTATLYSALRTDEAIGHVLDLAGWPAAQRVISTGDTTLTWWWLDGADAWDALVALTETEGTGAALYEDGLGRVVFENRNYRGVAARSTTPLALFRDRHTSEVDYDAGSIGYDDLDTLYDAGGRLAFTDFRYAANLRDVYNDVSHIINRRVASASAAVWNYGQSLVLSASESKTIIARSSAGDPWQSVSNVTVTTDYVVSAGSLVSVTTTQLTATAVAIAFVAGGGGATVLGPASATTGPQLRAVAVPVVSTERIVQSVAGSSLLTTTRSLALQEAGASRELASASAQALVDAAAAYYRDPRPMVTIAVMNGSAEELEQCLLREISDRIAIVEEQTGVAHEFWVEAIHLAGMSGGLVRADLVCAKALDTFTPGLWDEALWNVGLWGT